MNFNYYYGTQADQFSFIKIPRALLIDSMFSTLSLSAKVLYGVLLDRMSLSMKNGWFDKENKVFIIYQISEIEEDLGLSRKKAMNSLAELEQFGLVEKKKRGLGLPNILYVKNFVVPRNCARGTKTGTSVSKEDHCTKDVQIGTSASKDALLRERLIVDSVDISVPLCAETGTIVEKSDHIRPEEKYIVDNTHSRNAKKDTSGCEKGDSRSPKIGTLEVPKSTPQEVPESTSLMNKTEKSNTYGSKNLSHPISSYPEGRYDAIRWEEKKTLSACRKAVRENIEYDTLLFRFPADRELVEGISEMIVETLFCQGESILIAQNTYPLDLVKSKFMKLRYPHIEYVIDCFKQTTTEVRNIKKYLLAALFNAPSTMDGYYKSAVNHDQYGTGM